MAEKKYLAARPIDIGSEEVDEDGRSVVHHYGPGDEVKGAAGFANLDGLVANRYLVEDSAEARKALKKAKAEADAVEALGPGATEVERSAARAEAAGAEAPDEIEETAAADSPATPKPKTAARKSTRKSTRRSPRT